MTRLWLLVALAALTRHHPVILALAVLAAAGVAVWLLVDCLRWPAVFEPTPEWSGAFA